MKTEKIFRMFWVALFVLGTMAMKAQTSIYVYQKDGTANEYDISDVDSVSLTPPPLAGVNLLLNPGFEDSPDGQTSDALSAPWMAVPENWFTSYYNGYTLPSGTSETGTTWTAGNLASIYSNNGDGTFYNGNGSAISFVRTGNYAARLSLSATSGIYQLVDVTPGDYQVCVNLAINQIGQSVIKSGEVVKILSPDGMTTYGTVPIPAVNKSISNIIGTVTIPDGVSQVRFQLDNRDYPQTSSGGIGRAPLMLLDECQFCPGICPGGGGDDGGYHNDNPDANLPIRQILEKYYTDADGKPTICFGSTPGNLLPPAQAGVNDEFSYITPGNSFKQTQIHPDNNTWNWSSADPWIPEARKYGQVIRMHCPISPQCSQWTKNLNRTPAELEQNMRAFMTAICQRFDTVPDVVKWMDVVNETINGDGSWFYNMKSDPSLYMNPWPLIGFDKSPEALQVDPQGVPLYIEYAFEIATQYAPHIKHIINQHNGVGNAITNKMKKLAIFLRDVKGYQVDGIAWQAHVSLGWETANNVKLLSDYIDWAHANGFEFHITELNVSVSSDAERQSTTDRQANTFLAITNTVVQKYKTGFVAINLWNMKSCGTSDSGKPLCGPWACGGVTPLPAALRIKGMLVDVATQ